MFNSPFNSTSDMGTNDLLKLKREMKHLEHSRQGITYRNRILQEKRMIFLNRKIMQQTPLLTSSTILRDLASSDIGQVRNMIQTLTALFDGDRKEIPDLVEGLFDLNLLQSILYHMGSTDQGLQSDSLCLLSILLSNQSNLFSDSFLRKGGDMMLEQVMPGIYSLDSLKHVMMLPESVQILYCFGNAPSSQLSRAFLDQGIPNLLGNLLQQQPPPYELLQTFSWFLNSCLSINARVFLDLQFIMIGLRNTDLTQEVVSNLLLYLGQLENGSEQQQIIRSELQGLLHQHEILFKLDVDQLNYISLSQVITLLILLIEVNYQVYYTYQQQYRMHINTGLQSAKEIVICETLKLLMTIGIECQELLSIADYLPNILNLLRHRGRQVRMLCLRLLNFIVVGTLRCGGSSHISEISQRNDVLNILMHLQEPRVDSILYTLLQQEPELQENVIGTILYYSSVDHPIRAMFIGNLRIYALLQNIGKIKQDEGLLVQANILYKQE